MSKLTKEYVEQNGEVVEVLGHWMIGLYESHDMTVTNNLGVQIGWIMLVSVEVDGVQKDVCTFEIETVSEIVNWNKGEQKVLYELVENATYEQGEYETMGVFETFQDAEEFAKNNYPVADLKELIQERYELERIKEYNGQLISLETLESIESSEYVTNVENNGLSGNGFSFTYNKTWLSVHFSNGEEIQVYLDSSAS